MDNNLMEIFIKLKRDYDIESGNNFEEEHQHDDIIRKIKIDVSPLDDTYDTSVSVIG